MDKIEQYEINSTNKRILFVDMAKGIGILSVIIAHIFPKDTYISQLVYTYLIPLFFICSGLIIKKHEGNSQKIGRILKTNGYNFVLYFLISLIYIAYDILIHGFILNTDKFVNLLKWDLLESFTFFGINVLWFVITMSISKAFYEILNTYFHRNKLRHLVIFIISTITCFFGMIIDYYLGNNHSGFLAIVYFSLIGILRPFGLLIFLDIGNYIKNFIFKFCLEKRSLKTNILIGLLLISFNFIFASSSGNIDWRFMKLGNIFIMFLLSVSGSVGILFICSVIENCSKIISDFLNLFGRNSLFIMIIHNYIIIDLLFIFFMDFWCNVSYIVRFIIVLLLMYILTLLFGRYFTKMIKVIKKVIS